MYDPKKEWRTSTYKYTPSWKGRNLDPYLSSQDRSASELCLERSLGRIRLGLLNALLQTTQYRRKHFIYLHRHEAKYFIRSMYPTQLRQCVLSSKTARLRHTHFFWTLPMFHTGAASRVRMHACRYVECRDTTRRSWTSAAWLQ